MLWGESKQLRELTRFEAPITALGSEGQTVVLLLGDSQVAGEGLTSLCRETRVEDIAIDDAQFAARALNLIEIVAKMGWAEGDKDVSEFRPRDRWAAC